MADPVVPSTRLDSRRHSPDAHLPAWARRAHPLVRRHLRLVHWRAAPPEFRPLLRRFAWQVGLIMLSLPLPALAHLALASFPLYMALLPLVFALYGYLLASFLVLPPALALYGYVLAQIGAATSRMILDEQQADTLTLLRTTPYSLYDIFLGKVAAGLWWQADNLALLVTVAGFFSLPPVLLETVIVLPLVEHPLLSRLAMILMLAATLARVLLEPVMVGALGIAVGVAARTRISAALTTGLLALAYFVLINLPRLLPLSWPLRLIVTAGLPLALPGVLIWGAFRLAAHLLRLEGPIEV